MRILIIKPSSLGDVLHTFPAVELIRRSVKDVEYLDWVVNDTLAPVVSMCPGVDRVIPFPRSRCFAPSALFPFLKCLRERTYDIAVDYQGLLRSALISKAAKHPIIWGFKNAREGARFFYDVAFQPSTLDQHALLKNMELTRACFQIPGDEPPRLSLTVPQEVRESALQMLGIQPSLPTVAVCFSSRWNSKNWSLAYFVQVLDTLKQIYGDFNCFLVGGEKDAADGERLCGLTRQCHPVNLAGKTTLPQLAALLQYATVLLTVDSGPMHIAAAAGTPCVALFGATSPNLTGPFSPDYRHTIIHTGCAAFPCMKKNCPKQQNCADTASPTLAVQAIQRYLTQSARLS